MRSDDLMSSKQPKLQDSMTNGAVTAIPNAPITVSTAATTTTVHPTTATGTIPQPVDITTMSDHDLLRYINPSCFDQGKPHHPSTPILNRFYEFTHTLHFHDAISV